MGHYVIAQYYNRSVQNIHIESVDKNIPSDNKSQTSMVSPLAALLPKSSTKQEKRAQEKGTSAIKEGGELQATSYLFTTSIEICRRKEEEMRGAALQQI